MLVGSISISLLALGFSVYLIFVRKVKPYKVFMLLLLLFVSIVTFAVITTKDKKNNSTEMVYNNPWDSSVSQVERFLQNNLIDPDSYEAIEWSAVQKLFDGSFSVRCKYRSKNSFGGYVVKNQIFYLDSLGSVINYRDLD